MTVSIAPAPERTRPDVADDPFDHYYCCDPDVALCGADISAAEETVIFEHLCPMCDVLEGTRCPECGEVR